MTSYVALLRGINVGGKNSLPMQDLRDIMGSLGCEDVRTYIQSGNAVFNFDDDAESLSASIKSAIEAQFGFAPHVHLLTVKEFESIRSANPFPEAVDTPKLLHVSFLVAPSENPNLDALAAVQTPTERFELVSNAFYLHAPDGIARSKLAAKVDRCLGVQSTSRNWRTVTKISELT
ncbi:MAG: DUF1697 domain-containing protein [Woeseiaceae bacterium]